MWIIEQLRDRPRVQALGVATCLLLTAAGWWKLTSWPQIGTDDEAFTTVDALFTAITSRDEQRLADCEQRLGEYSENGKLSASVANRLDAMIQQARSGQWNTSARQLYDFMLAQRGLP